MFGAETVNASPDVLNLCATWLFAPRSPQISDLSEHNCVVRIEGCVVKKRNLVVKMIKTVVKHKQFMIIRVFFSVWCGRCPGWYSAPLAASASVLPQAARSRLPGAAGSYGGPLSHCEDQKI
jgi:hypothetical protein